MRARVNPSADHCGVVVFILRRTELNEGATEPAMVRVNPRNAQLLL